MNNQKKYYLLSRRIDGRNFIREIMLTPIEITSSKLTDGTELINGLEFLAKYRLDNKAAINELAQVLKISSAEFQIFFENSSNEVCFLTNKSAENIISYLNVRFCPKMIDFLSCQSGDAGSKNYSKA